MSARRAGLGGCPRTALLTSLAVAAWACQSDPSAVAFVPPVPVRTTVSAPEGPRREIERAYFAGTEELFFFREVLVLPDGRRLRHGREMEWYRGGALRHERFFDRGEPAGLWRSWHRDGGQHAAIGCDPGSPRTATWWHENGRMSSQGESVGGLKAGAWTHWYPSGAVAERGRYAGGLRQGEWTLWYESGALRARGEYRNDVRVGPWQWWASDGRTLGGPPLESNSSDGAVSGEDAPSDQ